METLCLVLRSSFLHCNNNSSATLLFAAKMDKMSIVCIQPTARTPTTRRRKVSGFFSDLLFQPHHCATASIKPEWLSRSTVDRRAGLSPDEFRRLYEEPNRPVVLTDAAARCVFVCVCVSVLCVCACLCVPEVHARVAICLIKFSTWRGGQLSIHLERQKRKRAIIFCAFFFASELPPK